MSETNKPVYKVRCGNIEGSVWKNESSKEDYGDFFTISMHRNYKDKDNNWKTTSTLRINDVPDVNLVLSKCFEYAKITSKNSEE